ncbi:protein MCM10 homolog [Sycon ciliatum]|uniref:protein MCM10 homolog n=1 Tax=Sycon ciliatum TaxID=27933 RepID=UPI0031F6C137
MDDDAELLASLIDDQDTDCDNDSVPTSMAADAIPSSVSSSSSQQDSKQANLDAMMAKMAEMQQQISTLQSQLASKPSDAGSSQQKSTSTSTAQQQALRGAQQCPASSPAARPSPDALFRQSGGRMAHTVSSTQSSQASSTSQSSRRQQSSERRQTATSTSSSSSSTQRTGSVRQSADDKSVKEIFSGLHLINPSISSTVMSQRMENRRMIRIPRLVNEKPSDSQLGDSWVTIGVLIKKNVKQSAKGTNYSIWTLSDLSSSTANFSLFLFGKAHSEHWKMSECTVVAVLAPGSMDKAGSDVAFKIGEPEKLMQLGQSRDAGYCKSVTKAGNKCRSIINKSTCEFCEYHVQAEYRRVSAKRMECQGSSQKPQSKNIMERVIGKNKMVSYGGQSYGAPSRTARDLQGIKSTGPMAKSSLHQMSVPNSAAALKELDSLRKSKPAQPATRATGQVMCSSASKPSSQVMCPSTSKPTSQVFQQMIQADSPGARLLRGAQRSTGSDGGDGSGGDQIRTARDMLFDEDKEHGHVRAGMGNLPYESTIKSKLKSGKKSSSQQSTPSSRPELGGAGKQSQSRSSKSASKSSQSQSGSASFSDALGSSSSSGSMAGSKRKSTTSSAAGDRKRRSQGSSALFDDHVDIPLGGEAFCDDQMTMQSAFDDDDSLDRYVKTPAVKTCTPSTGAPVLGRGLVKDGEATSSAAAPGSVDVVLPSSSSPMSAPTKSNEIHTRRQQDAMERAITAVQKSGGLATVDPNAVPGKRAAVAGNPRESQKSKTAIANAIAPPASSSNKKRSLSALMEMSDSDVQRVSKAKSSHYDEAKLLELEQQERYFNKLERKEDMENKMKTVMEIKVKVVQCKECSYTAESASKRCSTEHKEKLVWSQTMKRFFECEGCKQREMTYGGAWPTVVCKCGLSNYRRVSMFKEKSYKPTEFEWNSSSLLIRGVEHSKFVSG